MKSRVPMAPLVALAYALLLTTAARAQEAPVPVSGRELAVTLAGGDVLRGELIGAAEESLVLLADSELRTIELDEVTVLRFRRHRWGAGQVATWVGIGALVTGAGLTIACSQVEDADCAGVFPATVAVWALFGVPFAVGIARSAWSSVPPRPEALRPYARFPQGVPSGFRVGEAQDRGRR
jgi:hypothetical protein